MFAQGNYLAYFNRAIYPSDKQALLLTGKDTLPWSTNVAHMAGGEAPGAEFEDAANGVATTIAFDLSTAVNLCLQGRAGRGRDREWLRNCFPIGYWLFPDLFHHGNPSERLSCYVGRPTRGF